MCHHNKQSFAAEQFMDDLPDKWHTQEMELNKRHAAILLQRETLLNRHKASIKRHELMVKKRRKDLDNAKERNERFVQELEVFDKNIRKQQQDCRNQEFEILKAKYWEMVTRELSCL